MKKIKIFSTYFFLLFLYLLLYKTLLAQKKSKSNSALAINYVYFDASNNSYHFGYANKDVYEYQLLNGSLNGLRAYDRTFGEYFLPSNYGGPVVKFNSDTKYPWDAGVSFVLRGHQILTGDTVLVRWSMNFNSMSYYYAYKFKISYYTLTIKVEAEENPSNINAVFFNLDRCENAASPFIIRVPYLTLFNLLYANNIFTSLYFDWETTNASSLTPQSASIYSSTSVRFSQIAEYNPKTDGGYNSLKETIYLTTGTSIREVLPNLIIPNPSSTYNEYKIRSSNKTVISYGPPYIWLLTPPTCSDYTIESINLSPSISSSPFLSPSNYSSWVTGNAIYNSSYYKLLHLLHNMGIDGLAVIIKVYQRLGFDKGYPNVLPANTFDTCDIICPQEHYDNNAKLKQLRMAVDSLGYLFALHENYVDAYDPSQSSGFSLSDCSLNPYPDGSYRRNWKNYCNDTSYVISPDRAAYYMNVYSQTIKDAIYSSPSPSVGSIWSYLDVHSAINIADVVDYNAYKAGSGLFKYVLQLYRSLPDILSNIYKGPVEGEGGQHQTFLYVGYFHDLEARLHTADFNVYGTKCPLFVDFDLYEMHGKSALHGVGHFQNFYAPYPDTLFQRGYLTASEVKRYIAYELAFGHSGFITKSNIRDHTIYNADLEYHCVYPVQGLIANARPVSVIYYKNGSEVGDASTYVKYYHNYWDYTSSDFMSQVKVTYDNGIIVCTNASIGASSSSWQITVGNTDGWFSYNADDGNGSIVLHAGLSTSNNFTLPPENGWVVYVPSNLISQLQLSKQQNSGRQSITLSNGLPTDFALHNNYPNPFNSETTIKFDVPEKSKVRIVIYNILGRRVTTLFDGTKEADYHLVKWNGTKLASGVYICRMEALSESGKYFSKEIKIMLLK